MSGSLTIYNGGDMFSVTAEGQGLIDAALAKAALIGRVSNPAENERAVAAQLEIRGVYKAIEAARVEAKAPFLDGCRKVDALANSLWTDLEEEEARLGKLCAEFHDQRREVGAPPPAVEGQVVKQAWKWEVTDKWELARERPGLVRVEANASEINRSIKAAEERGEHPRIPGLRIWQETQCGVRTEKKETVNV